MDTAKRTSEELLKAAFREAAKRDIEELENAANIPILPPTDRQKEMIYCLCGIHPHK